MGFKGKYTQFCSAWSWAKKHKEDIVFSMQDPTYLLGRLDTEKGYSVRQSLYRSVTNVALFGIPYKIYNSLSDNPHYNIELDNYLNGRPNINGNGGWEDYETAMSAIQVDCAQTSDLPLNPDGSIKTTNARLYWTGWFGETEGLNEIYTNGGGVFVLAENYGMSYDGSNYYNWRTKRLVNGSAEPLATSKPRYSDVYLSDCAFRSQWDLHLTMGHERIHVLDYYYGRFNPYSQTSADRSDLRAYRWMEQEAYRYYPIGHPFYNNTGMGPAAMDEYFKLKMKYE
jgi:hypothetical protein